MNLEFVSMLVVGIATIMVPLRVFQAMKNNAYQNTYEREANYVIVKAAQKKAGQYLDKVALLESHSSDYFNSLHETGLGELIVARNELTVAMHDLQSLSSSGCYKEAQELAKFLTTPMAKSYPGVARLTTAKLQLLEDWERKTNDVLIACVIKLSVMSSKKEEAGIQRARKRKPTVHTLDELRSALEDYRPNV